MPTAFQHCLGFVGRKNRNYNAIGMADLIASEFIPWKEGCEICQNAAGMAEITMP